VRCGWSGEVNGLTKKEGSNADDNACACAHWDRRRPDQPADFLSGLPSSWSCSLPSSTELPCRPAGPWPQPPGLSTNSNHTSRRFLPQLHHQSNQMHRRL
jgi:hypothetical protein